jgi:hypothetical protein
MPLIVLSAGAALAPAVANKFPGTVEEEVATVSAASFAFFFFFLS